MSCRESRTEYGIALLCQASNGGNQAIAHLATKSCIIIRKEKRAVRKAQRQQRRDAFKSFKDQVDLEALETASNFE